MLLTIWETITRNTFVRVVDAFIKFTEHNVSLGLWVYLKGYSF